jgi:hypothetical protein
MSLQANQASIKAKPTEGAGVHLRRASASATSISTRFAVDDFRNDIPNDYLAGFPHPHRVASKRLRMCSRTVGTAEQGNHGAIAPGTSSG